MKEILTVNEQLDIEEEIAYSIVRVSYKLLGGDRATLKYGTDVNIYGSEIHMICFIKKNPDSYISSIAKSIHVTRGAVSQIVARLKRKGLVETEADPENLKRKKLKLTEKGLIAYEGHQKIHTRFNQHIGKIFSDMGEKDKEKIMTFYNKLEKSIEELVEQL